MKTQKCDLCPRKCGVNREKGEIGVCGGGNKIEIAWSGKHFGEEPVISGPGGSGTVFFCHCNLKCVFCQNWQISQESEGYEGCKGDEGDEGDEMVKMMLELQEQGAENINLVSPTIWSYWLKEEILKTKKKGLKIPIVWNSNGYEEVRVLRDLGEVGAVDIYLPDYKYDEEKLAVKYSSAPDYPKIAKQAILEMQKQVGDLRVGGNEGNEGVGVRGLIVRHLILPGQIENTIRCLKFIRSISPNIHLSLMSQYNPLYRAKEFPEINRELKKEEYVRILRVVRGLGFRNGWVQEFGEAAKPLTPDFRKEKPFIREVGDIGEIRVK